MFGFFLYSLCNIFTAGILYEKKSYILVYIYLGWGIINILLNIIMIQKFQIIGAVITAIITRFGISLTALFISNKYFRFPVNIIRYFKLIIPFSIVVFFKNNFFLADLGVNEIFINCILLILFFIIVYAVVLENKEKTFLKSIFRLT